MKLTRNNLLLAAAVLAFLGFADATYLTVLHYLNSTPICSLSSRCDVVLHSYFATILGIPISLIGVIFYAFLLCLSLSLLVKFGSIRLLILYLYSILGLIISVVLFLTQAFVLKSYCQYCLASEVISILLFLVILKIKFSEVKKSGAKPK